MERDRIVGIAADTGLMTVGIWGSTLLLHPGKQAQKLLGDSLELM